MRKTKGFTLIECLIAIAVLSITLTAGFNGLQSLLIKQRVAAYSGQLLQSVHTARQYAILRSKSVTICASENGTTCVDDWSKGHMIFIDQNSDRVRDENEAVLNHIHGNQTSDPVSWKSFKAASTLQFLPTGITNHQNGTFTVCGNGTAKYARAVIITKMGRPRMSQDTNGDGIDEGADGKPLKCE